MRLLPVIAASLLIGCVTDPADQRITDVDVALQRWQAAGHRDYTFDLSVTCFGCLVPGFTRVTVRAGIVTAATLASGVEADPRAWPSMDALLLRLRDGRRAGTPLVASFDGRGVLREGTLGLLENDSGVRYTVGRFDPE